MNISYQYANKENTSILLKFEGLLQNQTCCFLIDSGDGVDVDSLLGENEYLTGILLTHLHRDHYNSISDNLRDGAKLYSSKENIDLLETVLTTANNHHSKGIDIDSVMDSAEAITNSTKLLGDLTISTVPAGHTPGATSFYIQFEKGGKTETILITGDFTRRSVAGYPGLKPHNTDCIILTGATEDSFEENLTEATKKIVQHSHSGSPTLVTASGLNSVHIAYILGNAIENKGNTTQISIVGQAAKIYQKLGYDVPHVSAFPTYDSKTVLDKSEITISGPDTPTSGGSKKLFDEIRDNKNAALYQLISGNEEDIGEYNCTVNQYKYINHPSQETIDQLVRLLNPKQLIVTHQNGSDLRKYRDKYNSVVWACNDNREHTFYRNKNWIAPEWVNDRTAKNLLNDTSNTKLEIPKLDTDSIEFSRQDLNFESEGVDVNKVFPDERYKGKTKYTTEPQSEKEADAGINDRSRAKNGGSASSETEASPSSEEADMEEKINDILERLEELEQDGQKENTAEVVHKDKETVVLKLDKNGDINIGDEMKLVKKN